MGPTQRPGLYLHSPSTHSWRVKRKRGKGSLLLTKYHAMKMYWGVEVYLHAFLTSALDGGEWSALRPGRFTHRKRAPGTHWIGGWVGPRAVLDTVVKRKIPSLHRESNPRTPIVRSLVAIPTELSRLYCVVLSWSTGTNLPLLLHSLSLPTSYASDSLFALICTHLLFQITVYSFLFHFICCAFDRSFWRRICPSQSYFFTVPTGQSGKIRANFHAPSVIAFTVSDFHCVWSNLLI
jgi:hypothetical protein